MQIQIDVGADTPLAVAYLQAQALKNHADFYDLLTRTIERELDETDLARDRLEALLDRLITGLDEVDGDADFEPYLAGTGGLDGDDREGEGHAVVSADADSEPSLGWTESGELGPQDIHPYYGELETSLGWTTAEARSGEYAHIPQDDDEPTLGASEAVSRGGGVHSFVAWNGRISHVRVSGQQAWGSRPTALHLDDAEEDDSDKEPSLCGITVSFGDDRDREHDRADDEAGAWSESASLTGVLDGGREDEEHTAPEHPGRGYPDRLTPDDLEEGHDAERVADDDGLADMDALHLWMNEYPLDLHFDGSGERIATSMLRRYRRTRLANLRASSAAGRAHS